MSTPFQQSPYLKEQKHFPNRDLLDLSGQVDIAYIDIAQKINARTIGTFGLGFPLVTGEKWFLSGSSTSQQTLRQLYTFTAAGNIAHGIDINAISGFTKIYGTFSNGTNWYPLPFVDSSAVGNQVSVYVSSSNIVISAGGSAPTITTGYVILEWLSEI